MTSLKLVIGLIAAALVAGGVSGAVASSMLASGKKETRVTKEEPNAESEEIAALRRRVSTLESEMAAYRGLRAGTQRASAAAPSGASGTAAPAAAPVIDDPVFEVAVRDVVDRIQEEREADRELERQERRRRMTQRWSDDLGQKLQLNDAQKTKVQSIVQEFFDKMRAMRNPDAGASPGNREERRARAQQLRQESERRLREVLDPTQMRKYEELGEESRLGGRMGGQRRGRN